MKRSNAEFRQQIQDIEGSSASTLVTKQDKIINLQQLNEELRGEMEELKRVRGSQPVSRHELKEELEEMAQGWWSTSAIFRVKSWRKLVLQSSL